MPSQSPCRPSSIICTCLPLFRNTNSSNKRHTSKHHPPTMSKIPTVQGIPVPPIPSITSADIEPIPKKKPSKAKDATGAPPSRWYLKMTAGFWRSLQVVGMSLHYLAPPRPPNPSFSRTIPSTISKSKGDFKLHFYTPKSYSQASKSSRRFPAVVNFHGGGFTLGNATDDARFGRFVLDTCDALFICVDYRLAPEFPFPTAVDDGADALLYLVQHADELHIDASRLATSGFSAGGNIAITAPLRLAAHLKTLTPPAPAHRIRAVATWYPITDYTLSRAERRATAVRPDQTLPPTLTNLFDASYLFPPDLDLGDPFLSPSRASDAMLAEGIPDTVVFYTCEWDMLLREGEELATRLGKPPVGKTVHYKMIPEVPHGWDKSPDPLRPAAGSEELYDECCGILRDVFEEE
ncbi:Alpha/Beta hydrolase protein [Cercophora scortea]|uniref:Alpha/Beta hydrolase protein n=1 Tax=Cercophora scortea TaxID=314031 RepID=A0AAE0IXF2_9PEZI|nr:Alpha/Beta hydrolase protein [Cercophora scortea]